MKRFTVLILSFVLLGFSLHYLIFSTENDNDKRVLDFKDKYAIYALDIPNQLSFADEAVPLDDIDVRERIDRELLVNTYWQSSTLLLIKRAHRWFPVIEPILKEQGVPEDFKYLALAESGLTNVISPAGATGFWQFLKSTGTSYGLEINAEVDERYDLEKSTVAACMYLKEAHERFGSWSLAAASYNMGMDGLARQQSRQKSKSYWDLLLNDETSRYVFRIMSFKEIINNPENMDSISENVIYTLPTPTKTELVNYPVSNFAAFAKERGINYKQLKMLNPWLRDNMLTNKYGKTYKIMLLQTDITEVPTTQE